ncbi:hypothetical protein ACH46Q_11345 [Micrococcus luteus]|uniref:hypothetical protein n=1 Tax=Micrococcus luteus TaxID=1270 RepID=UPI0037A3E1B5
MTEQDHAIAQAVATVADIVKRMDDVFWRVVHENNKGDLVGYDEDWHELYGPAGLFVEVVEKGLVNMAGIPHGVEMYRLALALEDHQEAMESDADGLWWMGDARRVLTSKAAAATRGRECKDNPHAYGR